MNNALYVYVKLFLATVCTIYADYVRLSIDASSKLSFGHHHVYNKVYTALSVVYQNITSHR